VTVGALTPPQPAAGLEAAGLPSAVIRQVRAASRRRVTRVSLVLVAVMVLTFCVTLSVGDFPVPLRDVVPVLLGNGSSDADFIVRTLRLPRAIAAVLVGAAFGMAGAMFQSLARNPLASPDVIGITAGASTAAVAVIVLAGGSSNVVSAAAFAGALVTAAAIYLLAYRRGVSSYRLVLVGIGMAAVLGSITAFLFTRAQVYDAQRAAVWITGSLNGTGWEQVRTIGLAMVVLVPLALVLGRPLRMLQLGEETAAGLGVPVQRSQAAILVVAVALTAVATATAGPIAFVAFVAAPIARRLVRSPLSLVPSALAGAVLLLVSDLVARRAFAPTELPVGLITGILGAPYLLWLLARANKIGRGG
jgi:iron complex transport system permease protein